MSGASIVVDGGLAITWTGLCRIVPFREGIFPLSRQLVGEGTLFMLKVAGESMIGTGIADGDWWSSGSRRTRRSARSSRP
jgi:hypothetical protein